MCEIWIIRLLIVGIKYMYLYILIIIFMFKFDWLIGNVYFIIKIEDLIYKIREFFVLILICCYYNGFFF